MRNRQKILLWLAGRKDNPVCNLLYKVYEPLSYLIFGVLTTLVNMGIYITLENILGQDNWYLSNFPAITLAILFAYVTNRSFVFSSDGKFFAEMYKFFGSRVIVSLTFEYGLAYLLYNVIGFDNKLNLIVFSVSWFKIIAITAVVVANYLASKFFVFRTGKGEAT